MEKSIKTVVGIPTIGTVDWRFASSLMALQFTHDTRVIWQVKTMIDTARNNIVEQAMSDLSYTHLLFLDDDMTFDSDFLNKLLSHDVDIVSGLAFKRRPEYQPCVYMLNHNDDNYYPVLPNVFQEIDVAGTAGLLIKMDVFKKVKKPWFTTYYDDQGRHWSVDFDFCIKAKKEGYKIFCDPTATMGHIGDPEVVTRETFVNHCNKLLKTNDTIHKLDK